MATNSKPTRFIKSIRPNTMYTNIGPIYDNEPGEPPSLYMARALDAKTFKEDKDLLKKKQKVILEARAKAEAVAEYKKTKEYSEYKKTKEYLDILDEYLKKKKEKPVTNKLYNFKWINNRSGRKSSKPKKQSKTQKRKSKTQKNKKSK